MSRAHGVRRLQLIYRRSLPDVCRLTLCRWALPTIVRKSGHMRRLHDVRMNGVGRGIEMPVKFDLARWTAEEALQFHSQGKPGKLEIAPTKPLTTQRDLSLAYSPGVAVPVQAIAQDPQLAYDYTNKGNLVAVVSNGTAILG